MTYMARKISEFLAVLAGNFGLRGLRLASCGLLAMLLTGLMMGLAGDWAGGRAGSTVLAQSQSSTKATPPQDIPDAPSAVRPPQPVEPFPAPAGPGTGNNPPANAPPSGSPEPAQATPPSTLRDDLPPPPPFDIKTVREGQAPPSTPPGAPPEQDELYKITVNTNFVQVPVTVKDRDGHLVDGLLPRDFTVLENNVPQKISFFSSDPFAMSVAVVIDLSLPDIAVNRIHQTFSALQGSFAPYDEVALYTYSATVRRMSDFRNPQSLDAVLQEMKNTEQGRSGGVPVVGGPLASGPVINGHPLDGGGPIVNTVPKESHALNDAIVAAALDLGRRKRDRRRVIFVVSDGREDGSKASFTDALKVLLSRDIAVYAVAVDSAALPGYGRLQRIKVPRYGYGNILPKYVNATAGQLYTEFSRQAIESAYARLTSEARNQYTLGYVAKASTSGAKREIEVRVKRPEVQVFAKEGYYPVPTTK